jgi:hypothetical protein
MMTISERNTQMVSAAGAASVLSTNRGLPAISVTPLSDSDISNVLSDLFQWEPARTRYSTYFFLLPKQQKIKQDEASKFLGLPVLPPPTVKYSPFDITGLPRDSVPSIILSVPINAAPAGPRPALNNLNSAFFRPPNPADPNDPGDLIFVGLSGFTAAYVPIPVANVVENYFVDGLTARLVLGKYATAAGLDQGRIDFVKENAPIFPNTYNTYQAPRSYVFPGPPATSYAEAYSRSIDNLLSSVPVGPSALLLGWEAGEDLSHLQGADSKYLADTWKLISQRFNPEQVGEMTAFALTYLSGYLNDQRIVAIAKGQNPAPVTNLAQIFADRDQSTDAGQVSQILSGFSAAVLSEFYFVARNSQAIKNSDLILARDANFVIGLQAGAVKATDVLFQDVFRLAYGLGQRDGYSEGYAAGEQDGYAQGYASASAALQGMADSGFWGTLGKVQTAAGAVAAVVYLGSLLGL